jgi:glycosyltransferase involved in cell wall biosynthesis
VLIELYIFSVAIIAYGLFTTLAVIGFNRLKRDVPSTDSNLNPALISIVLSARNEAGTIERCLEQLIKQQLPTTHFEVIVIDDASEDDTYTIAHQILEKSPLQFQVIKESIHQGKKKNIAKAIALAKGSIIVTTDADVVFRFSNWLSTISNYFEMHQPAMLVMPIDFETESGLLSTFQIVENIALTAITAGYVGIQKPFMCNGANLAFKKSAYESVNGYQSHLNISSGEDVFLLEAIKKVNRTDIHYVLSRALIVKTKAQTNFSDFFQQRIRWAYKAKYNSNFLNLSAGFIVMMVNLLMLAFFMAIINKSVIMPYLSIFVLSKFVFDFLLLFLASDYLGRLKYLGWIIPFQCVYWIYALVIGIGSLFIKPYWKNKKIN